MTFGIVLGTPGERAERVLALQLGGAVVTVNAEAYDPLVEERSRIAVAQRSRAASTVADMLPLLSPGCANALAALDPETMQAAGTIWLAAIIGADAVTSWRGVLTPDGAPVPLTRDAWQLACFSVPGFARAFLFAWLEPRMIEAASGNA
jgi:hypothetical protein